MFDRVNIPLNPFENLCAQESCKDLDNSFISNKYLSWIFNPLSAIPTKWSNTQNGQQPTNGLSLFDHFVGLALIKGYDLIRKSIA